ncbi:hypothetical protein F5X68DRAFT_201752 [Plectosphaerella plurivora]|uniref:F-box domain-containing protein n=1 Tax=Plectosphaerella plurivora TaxID=936078 RepID=A0A9P8VGR5_9PEZI|nr:hypothetical protein F5X68DRAFT_201752 [Plectosphaerella plurivora]
MVDFMRCPTELLAAIMGSCESLCDVKSLMLTCRRNHVVWLAHAPVIIAAVAPRTVLLFDEALMAVRATEMVHQAELAAQLPPAIDPRSLPISCRLPTPSELTAVVDLNRFAEYIQTRYCKVFDASQELEEMYYAPMGRWPPDRNRGFGDDWFPEEPEGMPQWTERFRRAIYTT